MKAPTVYRAAYFHEERAERHPVSGWVVLLLLTSLSSFLCLFTGLAISLFTAVGLVGSSSTLAYTTIALLFGFFGFLFLAAHCMDRIGRSDKETRLRYAPKFGLRDEVSQVEEK